MSTPTPASPHPDPVDFVALVSLWPGAAIKHTEQGNVRLVRHLSAEGMVVVDLIPPAGARSTWRAELMVWAATEGLPKAVTLLRAEGPDPYVLLGNLLRAVRAQAQVALALLPVPTGEA